MGGYSEANWRLMRLLRAKSDVNSLGTRRLGGWWALLNGAMPVKIPREPSLVKEVFYLARHIA
jgi:hypothetical protein